MIVVHLQDFHIEIIAQNGGGLFRQLHKKADPQGHIGAPENRNDPGGIPDFLHLLGRQAGGGDDRRKPVLPGIGEDAVQRRRVGEVDDGVRLDAAVGGVGVNGKTRMAFGVDIEARHDFAVAAFGDTGGDDPSHLSVASAEDQSQHGRNIPFLALL